MTMPLAKGTAEVQYVFQCFNHSPHEEYVEGSVATRLAPLYVVKKFDSLNFYEIRIHRTEFVGVDIPIDVVNKVEVTSQEDLFNALENGYPYITLSDDVRDPLIVTQDTMDVKKSLILDLNGKKLERISRNPMLNVKEGVTLTIVDSSIGQSGGLYNPVGTVLQVSGGSLDVRAGKYESGPRVWEYSSDLGNHNNTKIAGYQEVVYREQGKAETTLKMPIVQPDITTDGSEITAVNGNIYYDSAEVLGTNTLIPDDTYCFYVTGDSFTSGSTVDFERTEADFSYSYYAKEGSYEYAGTTESANTVQITIYGFKHNIRTAMGIAENETINADKVLSGLESAPFYATIKMLGGSLDINCSGTAYQGKEAKDLTVADYQAFGTGCFITYFGVEAASCVQFTGGEMKISTSGVLATINPSLIPKGKGKPLSSEGRSICVHNNGRNESGQMQANDEQRRLLQRIKHRSNLYVFCSLRQIEKTDSPAAAIAGVSFFVISAKCEFCGAKCLRTKVKVDIISDGIDCKR